MASVGCMKWTIGVCYVVSVVAKSLVLQLCLFHGLHEVYQTSAPLVWSIGSMVSVSHLLVITTAIDSMLEPLSLDLYKIHQTILYN